MEIAATHGTISAAFPYRRTTMLLPHHPSTTIHLRNPPVSKSGFRSSLTGLVCSGLRFRLTAKDSDEKDFVGDREQPNEGLSFLNQLDFKEEISPSKPPLELDVDDSYAIFIFGIGALVSLYISWTVISTLDSFPVIPKLMEVIGFGFTVWFCIRYLIFKKNRDELLAKANDLKKQILGSEWK